MTSAPKSIYGFSKKSIEQINLLLKLPKNIVITTHTNPDGDAIGSSLALANILKKQGNNVSIVVPNNIANFLMWMKGADTIVQFNNEKQKAIDLLEKAEIIFCLDYNNPKRTGDIAETLTYKSDKVKILIDHHLDPFDFCDYTFSFPDACATAELIYSFLKMMNWEALIDKDTAECLYAGIMTDSGNFRFKSVTPFLHQVTAFLLSKGADNNKVYEQVYDSYRPEILNLHGYVLFHKLIMLIQYNTVVITLSTEEQSRFNASKEDIDEIVNYGLKISRVKLCAFFYEQDGVVKTSFRSKGATSAKAIAMKYFNGGGHINAAGGTSNFNLTDTISYFESILPEITDLN